MQNLTHVVYLAMMLTTAGVPQQMGTEITLEQCQVVIQHMAALRQGTDWYCQPGITAIPKQQ